MKSKKILSMIIMLAALIAVLTTAVYAVEVSSVTALQTELNKGGTIVLKAYLYPDTTLTVPAGKTVTLNLNGWGIYGQGTGYIIDVKGNLTITSTQGWNGRVMRGAAVKEVSNSVIHVAPGAVLTLKPEGTIGIGAEPVGGVDFYNQARTGGAILVEGGTLNMYDGTFIQFCKVIPTSTDYTGIGGGVHLKDYTANGKTTGSTFNMYGGTIKKCYATGGTTSTQYMGGGVYVATNSTFKMTGGTITDCAAGRYGGGINTWGRVEISGGTIENCSTDNYSGGGLHIAKNTSLMSGGTIRNCTAKDYGGGVSAYNGNFDMTGGTIFNCAAVNSGGVNSNGGSGGGMYVTNGTINMSGGTIEKCYTKSGNNGGGAVMTGDNGTFTMSGSALITDCSSQYGGGVDAFKGTVNLNGGTIQNCTSSNSGGGVYACATATFKLNGTTITDCSSQYGGGIFGEGTGTIGITAGTIGKNTANSGSGVYSYGTVNYGANAVYSIENTYVPAITSTVTLEPQEGVGGTASVTATLGSNMPTATMPTRNGCRFLGYFDAKSGGTQYYTAAGASARVWDKAGDRTLYAQWEAAVEIKESTSADFPSVQAKIKGDTAVMRFMWQVTFEDGAKIENIGAYIIPWKIFDDHGQSLSGLSSGLVQYDDLSMLVSGDTFSADLTGIPNVAEEHDIFTEMEITAIPFVNGNIKFDKAITSTVYDADIDK